MWLENVMEKESKGVINPNKREVWGQHKQKGKQNKSEKLKVDTDWDLIL